MFLIGGGPGDPELLTERARRRLAEADLVLYDALIHPDLLAHCKPRAVLEFVGKRAGRSYERQASINQRLVEAARAGLVVARLKGGDPFLFGRGSEEAEHLAEAGIELEVVPGVPSPLAVTAYAGISLSHRDLASSVAYVTATESSEKDQSAHDWPKLATATQTLVIFMGMRKLDALMQTLIANGRAPDCPAAVIQSASLPSQRTVLGTVSTIAKLAREAGIGMPALTVVGEVVRLRERLRWYDKKPLFGKRVLVPRAEGQAMAMAQLLRDAGAEPVLVPAIRIAAPEDSAPLRNAVRGLRDYDFVVLTSQNGVEALFAEITAQAGDARTLGNARVVVIGPATAECLRKHGITADLMPDAYVGEAVADAIVDAHGPSLGGKRVLIPRAAVARDALPERLRAAGATVDVVAAYRTLPPSDADAARLRALFEERSIDVTTFTSSSTVEHVVQAIGARAREQLAATTVAVIGPITQQTAEQHRLRVDVAAEPYTAEGLVASLEAHFATTSTETSP